MNAALLNELGRWRSRLEAALWLGALALLATAGYRIASYQLFQKCPGCLVTKAVVLHASPTAPARPVVEVPGRLKVPRLHMDLAILNGDDDATLSLGAGHIPGTALPGSPGNSVIAGHRDMAFRNLRHIRVGDRIQLSGRETYDYVVRRILIVDPDDTSVLRQGNLAMLTMITCYPFRYIGSAPKRFIVQAALVTNN